VTHSIVIPGLVPGTNRGKVLVLIRVTSTRMTEGARRFTVH
jgi:hypothetical protein